MGVALCVYGNLMSVSCNHPVCPIEIVVYHLHADALQRVMTVCTRWSSASDGQIEFWRSCLLQSLSLQSFLSPHSHTQVVLVDHPASGTQLKVGGQLRPFKVEFGLPLILGSESSRMRETLHSQRSEQCFDPQLVEDDSGVWLTWKESKVERLQMGPLWPLDDDGTGSSNISAPWGDWAPWSHGQDIKR